MNARRIRRTQETQSKLDDRASGVFEIPASTRVARRGSTRVESETVDSMPRGRGGYSSNEG
jgi:hypothetical protein